jgi:hypothetical protein
VKTAYEAGMVTFTILQERGAFLLEPVAEARSLGSQYEGPATSVFRRPSDVCRVSLVLRLNDAVVDSHVVDEAGPAHDHELSPWASCLQYQRRLEASREEQILTESRQEGIIMDVGTWYGRPSDSGNGRRPGKEKS